ncbi:MAG: hypothetical protein KDD65_11495 [Bacteroidetes bacterium]|nr:hypothetical protein [Bacteroidota bacterium]
MDNPLQVLVTWLHVASGIVWVGGYIFATVIVWPSLMRRPPKVALEVFDSINKPISSLMGGAAQAVFWIGLLRGTVFGPIKSFHQMVTTGYGHLFMTSIILTIAAVVISAVSAARLRDHVFDGDVFRPGGIKRVLRTNTIVIVLFALILACMVAMRHGVY